MHGRPRKVPSQEAQDAASVKAAKIRDLQSQVLSFHHNKTYTKEALDINEMLLESNPEHYTGWNYRKLAVQYLLGQQSDAGVDPSSIQSILDEELRVVENALRQNFKSYGAWHHRKWILSMGHSSADREMRLLLKFQKLDSRNFHAWNYRRFITALKGIQDEEELQYTTDMIYDNFSNYSAWHNRSMLLSHLLEKRANGYDDKQKVLEEEFEFVRHAHFTDPDDQSGWFYHLWLLDQTLKREPRLLSSWPPHSSNLYLSVDGQFDDPILLPLSHFQSKDGLFPIILYFSEAVEGVSSSTVKIECEYHACEDIFWTPLSSNKTGFAQAWLTYLNFPNKANPSKTYLVKVKVADFHGIISLRGVSCSQSSHISFTVGLSSHEQEHPQVQSVQRISWKEENFKTHAAQTLDENLLASLCNFKIAMDEQPTSFEGSMKIVSAEIDHCRELLSTTNCKIGKLMLARLLMALATLISYSRPNDRTEVYLEKTLALYHDLMKMDPVHYSYYEDEYSLSLLNQMTSSMEHLLKYVGEYQDSSSPKTKFCLCVRLNSLSLSQIGSMECLLWVRMLDLSHNKLRSIEGLDALQLLSSLNLSNNKICSFTALGPLSMIKALNVLNISYNEIGNHPVDTRRYLCPSPLNHSVGNDWSFKTLADGDAKLSDHWAAYSIFKDLNLIQLDIKGNAVVDDGFKVFLRKMNPKLRWLDGENFS